MPPPVVKKRRYYKSLSLSLSSDDVVEVQAPLIEGLKALKKTRNDSCPQADGMCRHGSSSLLIYESETFEILTSSGSVFLQGGIRR